MILDILAVMFGSLVACVGMYFLYESSVMLSERNYLRKITGQYYDFDIDAKLKEMGITRAEALKDKDLWL